jgi:hypothetical protein
MEMDYLANKASFEEGLRSEYEVMLTERINRRSDNDIFARSEFKMPTFSHIGEKDINALDMIGKIVDNSDFSIPLVVFNNKRF